MEFPLACSYAGNCGCYEFVNAIATYSGAYISSIYFSVVFLSFGGGGGGNIGVLFKIEHSV